MDNSFLKQADTRNNYGCKRRILANEIEMQN